VGFVTSRPEGTGSGARRSADPRATHTRAKLARAFTTVAEGGAGAPLSVSAIVAEARVNRSSFYAHFDTTSDLAMYVLQDALAAISADDLRLRATGAATGAQASQLVLERILDQVERQRGELRAVFRSAVGWDARARFGDRLRAGIATYLEYAALQYATDPERAGSERVGSERVESDRARSERAECERAGSEPARRGFSESERAATAAFLGHGLAAAIAAWVTGELACSRSELLRIMLDLVPARVAGTPREPRGGDVPGEPLSGGGP
jgi:AcrR family transcriptional regulator